MSLPRDAKAKLHASSMLPRQSFMLVSLMIRIHPFSGWAGLIDLMRPLGDNSGNERAWIEILGDTASKPTWQRRTSFTRESNPAAMILTIQNTGNEKQEPRGTKHYLTRSLSLIGVFKVRRRRKRPSRSSTARKQLSREARGDSCCQS